jgi:glycerate dehydrogenase
MDQIIVLDGYALNPGDLSWAALEALGRVTVHDRTPPDQAAERLGQAGAALTNKTPVTRETLERCPNLKYIGVLATGYNIVDVGAARERGVTVTNIPVYGTAAVSQFAIALLLEICHHVGHHSQAVAAGRWAANPDWCFWDYPLIELAGKTMGIIGFGRIGQATGRLAQALGMTVVAHDALPSDSGRALAEYVSMDRLLAVSDVVVLHCPLLPATERLINRETIAGMKDGVIIINNSRGPLIAEADLAEALNRGKVYAAGLDVVSDEPIHPDNPLLGAKNCFITPHISWAPRESRQRLLNTAAENLKAFQEGRPQNVVNP